MPGIKRTSSVTGRSLFRVFRTSHERTQLSDPEYVFSIMHNYHEFRAVCLSLMSTTFPGDILTCFVAIHVNFEEFANTVIAIASKICVQELGHAFILFTI